MLEKEMARRRSESSIKKQTIVNKVNYVHDSSVAKTGSVEQSLYIDVYPILYIITLSTLFSVAILANCILYSKHSHIAMTLLSVYLWGHSHVRSIFYHPTTHPVYLLSAFTPPHHHQNFLEVKVEVAKQGDLWQGVQSSVAAVGKQRTGKRQVAEKTG